MNKFQTILFITFFSCMLNYSYAQESPFKNYLYTNFGYAFLSSGDQHGTALGISYIRLAGKNFGVKLSYNTVNASDGGTLTNYKPDQLKDVKFYGDSGFAVSYAHYKMVSAGPVFLISDGSQYQLLTSVGLNYAKVKDSSPTGLSITEDGQQYAINGYNFYSVNQIGAHISIDYLHFIKNNFSVGFQGYFYAMGSMFMGAGFTLGSRF